MTENSRQSGVSKHSALNLENRFVKQTWVDASLKRFLQITLRIFFSEITVLGAERISPTGSFVLVANHANALIDPALLFAFLPRTPRFLAKSTLWSVPVVRTLLIATRSIPVYRKMDAGVDTSKNDQTFLHCTRALAQGEAIALFPEGITHNEPSLQPLKTGAARIVLSAQAENSGLTVPIIPVGMTFDAKDRFRSRVLIVVGDALFAQAVRETNSSDAHATVRALTQKIDTELRRVTLNYPSWEEAHWIERAAALYARQILHHQDEEALSDMASRSQVDSRAALPRTAAKRVELEFFIRHQFATAYPRLKQEAPQAIEQVLVALHAYADLLASVNCSDEYDWQKNPPLRRWRARLRVRLPMAMLGLVLNWLPYRLAGEIGERTSRTLDQPATHKFMAGVVLFPMFWLLETWLAWQYLAHEVGLAVLFLAPFSGYVILRFHERRLRFREELRFQRILHTQKSFENELRRRRAKIVSALEALQQQDAALLSEMSFFKIQDP